MSIYARKYICTVAAFACVVAAPSHAQSTDVATHSGNKPSDHNGRRQRSVRTLHKRRAADRIARNASRRVTDKKGAGDVHTAHSAVRIVKGGKDRGVAAPVRSAPVKRDSSFVAAAPGVFEEAIKSTAPASAPGIPSARGYSLRPLVGSLLGAAVFAEFLRGRDVDTSALPDVGGIPRTPATPVVPVKPTTPSDTTHTTTPPVTPTPSDTTHTTTPPVTPTPSDTTHAAKPPVTPAPSDTGKKTGPVVPPVVPGPVPGDTTSMPPVTTTTAPEPGTIFLTATGLAALAAAKKRRSRR